MAWQLAASGFTSSVAILLGPRGDHLHAPDEWVEIEDLLTPVGVCATLGAGWSGRAD